MLRKQLLMSRERCSDRWHPVEITNLCLITGHALAATLTPQSAIDRIVSLVGYSLSTSLISTATTTKVGGHELSGVRRMGLGWLKIILSRYATKTYHFPPITPAYSYHCHHPRSHIETLTYATIYNEWSTVLIENGFLTSTTALLFLLLYQSTATHPPWINHGVTKVL